MGKKHKHSKDKLYQTVSELTSHYNDTNRELELSTLHRRLKFDSCCINLTPVSDKPLGLSDNEGFCYVFECDQLLKFLEKFGTHPITGKKISSPDLIELKYFKNDEGDYHCPVIYKTFNQLSKIVVNRKNGHVYSHEAYFQLNLKSNNFNDLLTDEPFEKEDILFIQDPEKADTKWNVANFHYVKNKLRLVDESNETRVRDIDRSIILKTSLDAIESRADQIAETFNRIVGQSVSQEPKVKLDKVNRAIYSDGKLSSSVTSTVMPVAIVQTAAALDEEQILYPRIKKKGYVQLVTNFGPLNLELFCDRTPKTCHNFMLLAGKGYYENTRFHRMVRDFILQGGDPTATGTGGESAWGEAFRDECHGDLRHDSRGVLAMANSGPNTNKSQFYLTLRDDSAHLDNKHTVFGRLVGGEDTLSRIEAVEVDKNSRPKQEIKIIRVIKYVDPFEEAEAQIDNERKEELRESSGQNDTSRPLKKFRSGVGTYIDTDKIRRTKSTKTNGSTKLNQANDNPAQSTLAEATSLSSRLAMLKSRSQSRFHQTVDEDH